MKDNEQTHNVYTYEKDVRLFGYGLIIAALICPFIKVNSWLDHPVWWVLTFLGGVFLVWVFTCTKFITDDQGIKVTTRKADHLDDVKYKCKFRDIAKISFKSGLYFLFLQPLPAGKKRRAVKLSNKTVNISMLLREIIEKSPKNVDIDCFAKAELEKIGISLN